MELDIDICRGIFCPGHKAKDGTIIKFILINMYVIIIFFREDPYSYNKLKIKDNLIVNPFFSIMVDVTVLSSAAVFQIK